MKCGVWTDIVCKVQCISVSKAKQLQVTFELCIYYTSYHVKLNMVYTSMFDSQLKCGVVYTSVHL